MTAKRWEAVEGYPTLAVHGWLDNASSFDVLAPALPELDIVALDLAGHGHSDHRPPGVHYLNYYDAQDVLAVANALGWDRFNLIGHSMGAEISVEVAGLFPERVHRLVMIDGLMATGGSTEEERRDRNREAIREALREEHRQPRVFADTAAMAKRVSEATGQSLDSSRLLVERGHKTVEGGVTWRTDPRIRGATPLRPSRAQIDLLLEGCRVPTLLMVAEGGDRWFAAEVENAEARHPEMTLKRLPGPHHLHMEAPYVERVIDEVRTFLKLD
jgi:pimeloyl-ACP methyl ester carboxylesterase